jgi:hypothetical protein
MRSCDFGGYRGRVCEHAPTAQPVTPVTPVTPAPANLRLLPPPLAWQGDKVLLAYFVPARDEAEQPLLRQLFAFGRARSLAPGATSEVRLQVRGRVKPRMKKKRKWLLTFTQLRCSSPRQGGPYGAQAAPRMFRAECTVSWWVRACRLSWRLCSSALERCLSSSCALSKRGQLRAAPLFTAHSPALYPVE